MINLLRKLFVRLMDKELVHFIPHSNDELELSDGDRAMLHGWPDKTIKEVMQHD